jgi:hypothetical protein
MINQLQFSEIMGCANLFQRFLTLAAYLHLVPVKRHLITRLTPGVLLSPDHRHEFKNFNRFEKLCRACVLCML